MDMKRSRGRPRKSMSGEEEMGLLMTLPPASEAAQQSSSASKKRGRPRLPSEERIRRAEARKLAKSKSGTLHRGRGRPRLPSEERIRRAEERKMMLKKKAMQDGLQKPGYKGGGRPRKDAVIRKGQGQITAIENEIVFGLL